MSAPGDIQRAKETSTLWETPRVVFNALDKEFWFSLDGAASETNNQCPRYYDEAANAFVHRPLSEAVFINPPYGRGLDKWIDLFKIWADKDHGCSVVALLPTACETAWYQEAKRTCDEERITPKRIRFELNGKPVGSNTVGSTIFVWWPRPEFRPDFRATSRYWTWE